MSDLDEWTHCLKPEGEDGDEDENDDDGDDDDGFDQRLDLRLQQKSNWRLYWRLSQSLDWRGALEIINSRLEQNRKHKTKNILTDF